jgi:hypothetical protein
MMDIPGIEHASITILSIMRTDASFLLKLNFKLVVTIITIILLLVTTVLSILSLTIYCYFFNDQSYH